MDYIKNNEENMNGNLLAGENMDAASDKVMQYRNVVLADNFPSYAKWKFIEIMLEKRDDEDSFGFILMKNNNSTKLLNKSASKVVKKLEDAVRHVGDKLVVVEILEGGAAHREGTMKLGDQIVAINNISMNQLTEQMAHHVMKQSGSSVTLCIEYITHFNNCIYTFIDFRTDNPTPILVHLKDFFVTPNEITLTSQQLSDADEEIIVVDNVYEAGNVDRLGLIQAGDQILEINHVNLRQKSLDDAIRILNLASQRTSASSNPLRQSALPVFSRYLDSTNISSPASSSLQLITFPSTYQFPPSPTDPTLGLVLCKDLYNNLDLLYNFKKATACIRSDDDDEGEDGRRKHPPLVRMKMLHRGNNLSSTERSSSLKSSFAGLDHFRSLSCVSNSFNEDTEKPNWFGEANNVNNKSCRTFSCIQPNEMNKHDVENEINFNSYFLEKYIQQNHQIKKQLSKESPLYTKKQSVQSHQNQCNNVNGKNMIDSANNSSVVNIEKKTPGGIPDDIRVNNSATFDDINYRNNPLNKELSSKDDGKHVLYQTKTIDNREHNTVAHAANTRTEADSRGKDEVSNITTPSTKQKVVRSNQVLK
ncbi:hypothetical protein HELRODRAFT_162256 [Helobdella robusta]|uniref:PDZ domain-containing protein n=1 Tax=Helobdella robusta TaxID=6412 RepID=T1ESF4_HELRO|nr:hypothetical protein HELRODRAFT_162256 [Helobdella robusta]ESN98796.1 hypothetical protein HELRODRAFT_162256 [Helobdella robusta]